MMTFTSLPSVPSEHPVPFTDQLRLAVAAYLARFKGASRYHTDSDLRCYLTRCAEHGLDPLAARRPHLELYIRWMLGDPPVQALHRFPAVIGHRGVLPHLRHRRPAGALTRRARPPALRPARIADPGVHPPAIRGLAHRRPGIPGAVRLRPGGHARATRPADLRSHRCRHRRPRRRTRPPGAARMRQRHQGRPGPAPASRRPGYRPRARHPSPRADPAQQPRCPDGPPRRDPPPAAPRRDRGRADRQAAPSHAPPYVLPVWTRVLTCGMSRSPPGTLIRAPRCATTAPGRTSTGTRTTSWPPTWPPAPDCPLGYSMRCALNAWEACIRSRSSPKSGPGWPG